MGSGKHNMCVVEMVITKYYLDVETHKICSIRHISFTNQENISLTYSRINHTTLLSPV